MSEKLPTSLKSFSADNGVKRIDAYRVDPDLIVFEEKFNVRLDGDELDLHIQRIREAMEAGAVVPAIDVQVIDGQIICRDGHCRTMAARLVKQRIPEYTLECRQFRGNDADAIFHMVGTGSGGKPLSPLEQGIGFLRLLRLGFQPSAIAARLGISRPTVDNGLKLAEAPAELQGMIQAGEVSATTARQALAEGSAAVEELKDAVKEERKKTPESSTTGDKEKTQKPKKVTAKKLNNRKAKLQKPEEPKPDPSKVSVTLDREIATSVLELLKTFAEEGNLKNAIPVFEIALM